MMQLIVGDESMRFAIYQDDEKPGDQKGFLELQQWTTFSGKKSPKSGLLAQSQKSNKNSLLTFVFSGS